MLFFHHVSHIAFSLLQLLLQEVSWQQVQGRQPPLLTRAQVSTNCRLRTAQYLQLQREQIDAQVASVSSSCGDEPLDPQTAADLEALLEQVQDTGYKQLEQKLREVPDLVSLKQVKDGVLSCKVEDVEGYKRAMALAWEQWQQQQQLGAPSLVSTSGRSQQQQQLDPNLSAEVDEFVGEIWASGSVKESAAAAAVEMAAAGADGDQPVLDAAAMDLLLPPEASAAVSGARSSGAPSSGGKSKTRRVPPLQLPPTPGSRGGAASLSPCPDDVFGHEDAAGGLAVSPLPETLSLGFGMGVEKKAGVDSGRRGGSKGRDRRGDAGDGSRSSSRREVFPGVEGGLAGPQGSGDLSRQQVQMSGRGGIPATGEDGGELQALASKYHSGSIAAKEQQQQGQQHASHMQDAAPTDTRGYEYWTALGDINAASDNRGFKGQRMPREQQGGRGGGGRGPGGDRRGPGEGYGAGERESPRMGGIPAGRGVMVHKYHPSRENGVGGSASPRGGGGGSRPGSSGSLPAGPGGGAMGQWERGRGGREGASGGRIGDRDVRGAAAGGLVSPGSEKRRKNRDYWRPEDSGLPPGVAEQERGVPQREDASRGREREGFFEAPRQQQQQKDGFGDRRYAEGRPGSPRGMPPQDMQARYRQGGYEREGDRGWGDRREAEEWQRAGGREGLERPGATWGGAGEGRYSREDPRLQDPRYQEQLRYQDPRYQDSRDAQQDARFQQDPRYAMDPRLQDPREPQYQQQQDPRYRDPRFQEPGFQDARQQQQQQQDARFQDPRYGTDPRGQDPRFLDPMDPRGQDPRYSDPRFHDPQQLRYGDSRGLDPRYPADMQQQQQQEPMQQYSDPRDPRYQDPRMQEPRYQQDGRYQVPMGPEAGQQRYSQDPRGLDGRYQGPPVQGMDPRGEGYQLGLRPDEGLRYGRDGPGDSLELRDPRSPREQWYAQQQQQQQQLYQQQVQYPSAQQQQQQQYPQPPQQQMEQEPVGRPHWGGGQEGGAWASAADPSGGAQRSLSEREAWELQQQQLQQPPYQQQQQQYSQVPVGVLPPGYAYPPVPSGGAVPLEVATSTRSRSVSRPPRSPRSPRRSYGAPAVQPVRSRAYARSRSRSPMRSTGAFSTDRSVLAGGSRREGGAGGAGPRGYEGRGESSGRGRSVSRGRRRDDGGGKGEARAGTVTKGSREEKGVGGERRKSPVRSGKERREVKKGREGGRGGKDVQDKGARGAEKEGREGKRPRSVADRVGVKEKGREKERSREKSKGEREEAKGNGKDGDVRRERDGSSKRDGRALAKEELRSNKRQRKEVEKEQNKDGSALQLENSMQHREGRRPEVLVHFDNRGPGEGLLIDPSAEAAAAGGGGGGGEAPSSKARVELPRRFLGRLEGAEELIEQDYVEKVIAVIQETPGNFLSMDYVKTRLRLPDVLVSKAGGVFKFFRDHPAFELDPLRHTLTLNQQYLEGGGWGQGGAPPGAGGEGFMEGQGLGPEPQGMWSPRPFSRQSHDAGMEREEGGEGGVGNGHVPGFYKHTTAIKALKRLTPVEIEDIVGKLSQDIRDEMQQRRCDRLNVVMGVRPLLPDLLRGALAKDSDIDLVKFAQDYLLDFEVVWEQPRVGQKPRVGADGEELPGLPFLREVEGGRRRKEANLCNFWRPEQHGGCARGNACSFRHLLAPGDGGDYRGDGGGYRGGGYDGGQGGQGDHEREDMGMEEGRGGSGGKRWGPGGLPRGRV